jgi:PAS domain S-box-containing protein
MHKSSVPEQIAAMRRRITTLYRNASTAPQEQELLPIAFEELQNAMEELQAMQEELNQQHEHLLTTREHAAIEFQFYKDLFVEAPVPYLITSPNGVIRYANRMAAELFSSAEKFMVGRSLMLFVPDGERRLFRERMAQVARSQYTQVWETNMQSWAGTPFRALLTTAVAYGRLGHATAVRWIVQNMARISQGEQIATSAADLADRARMVGGSS